MSDYSNLSDEEFNKLYEAKKKLIRLKTQLGLLDSFPTQPETRVKKVVNSAVSGLASGAVVALGEAQSRTAQQTANIADLLGFEEAGERARQYANKISNTAKANSDALNPLGEGATALAKGVGTLVDQGAGLILSGGSGAGGASSILGTSLQGLMKQGAQTFAGSKLAEENLAKDRSAGRVIGDVASEAAVGAVAGIPAKAGVEILGGASKLALSALNELKQGAQYVASNISRIKGSNIEKEAEYLTEQSGLSPTSIIESGAPEYIKAGKEAAEAASSLSGQKREAIVPTPAQVFSSERGGHNPELLKIQRQLGPDSVEIEKKQVSQYAQFRNDLQSSLKMSSPKAISEQFEKGIEAWNASNSKIYNDLTGDLAKVPVDRKQIMDSISVGTRQQIGKVLNLKTGEWDNKFITDLGKKSPRQVEELEALPKDSMARLNKARQYISDDIPEATAASVGKSLGRDIRKSTISVKTELQDALYQQYPQLQKADEAFKAAVGDMGDLRKAKNIADFMKTGTGKKEISSIILSPSTSVNDVRNLVKAISQKDPVSGKLINPTGQSELAGQFLNERLSSKIKQGVASGDTSAASEMVDMFLTSSSTNHKKLLALMEGPELEGQRRLIESMAKLAGTTKAAIKAESKDASYLIGGRNQNMQLFLDRGISRAIQWGKYFTKWSGDDAERAALTQLITDPKYGDMMLESAKLLEKQGRTKSQVITKTLEAINKKVERIKKTSSLLLTNQARDIIPGVADYLSNKQQEEQE